MKAKFARKMAKEIYRRFSGSEVLLVDYIGNKFDSLVESLENDLDPEKLLETLAYEFSKEFINLKEYLRQEIEGHRPSNRIELREDIEGVQILLSTLGLEVIHPIEDEYYKYFRIMESLEKMEKGIIYENFCVHFLEDLGMEAETTPPSNDKGIDLIAKYRTKLSEEKSQLVFDDYVYLIGQAKFLSEKVDTPIIRRLVGDSLFIRFNQLQYVELSHNAIHQIVFSHCGFTDAAISFCKTSKVMRIETSQMVTILSSTNHPELSKSLHFLRNRLVGKTMPY